MSIVGDQKLNKNGLVQKDFRWCISILGFGFFGIFMAFNTAQALATSLPGGPAGLGTASLGILYIVFTLACFVAPPVVDKLGLKGSLMLGAVMYIPMILAPLKQTYTVWIPANILVGLGAPLLWTACGLYIGRCSQWEALRSGRPNEECTSAFNGFFMSFYQANGVIGLLIGGFMLRNPSVNMIHILFIALTFVCGLGGLLMLAVPQVSACVAPLDCENRLLADARTEPAPPTVLGTLRQAFTVPRMTLLVPIIFFNGLSLGFFFGSFTKNVVTKVLDLSYAAFATASFYGMNAVCSYFFGRLAGRCGRRPIMAMAVVVHLVFFIAVGWFPPNSLASVWVLTLMFAAADSVWETFPNAIAQGFFSDNDAAMSAAMANFKGWQSLGMATNFLLSMPGVLGSDDDVLRNNSIILLSSLVVGSVCLVVLNKCVSSLDPVADASKASKANADGAEP